MTSSSSFVPSPLVKYQEMSPEVTLVEFISTTAAFHRVNKIDITQLEWDLLKVFPNNIMPANAAAWYMAKRRFYINANQENQLLPFLLKNYPKKFQVKGNEVRFLEVYSPFIAKRKLGQMIHNGLVAYFSHKADEYGVYFFDPFYYETTEPFHANLRHVTRQHNAHRSKLLPAFFAMHDNTFHYQSHSPYLVTISKHPVEVKTNVTGVIVKIVDNQFGILQFRNGEVTEKALFSAKALFKDGWNYEGDPMKLPPVEFDGYRLPRNPTGRDYNWHAALVWAGRKPSPKFCATKDDLTSSPYFQKRSKTNSVSCDELLGSDEVKNVDANKDACVQVGEVLDIKETGAIVSMGKDTEDQAWIAGWGHRYRSQKGLFLTTTQGVELAIKDLITFCVDQKETRDDFKAVGCNVTVLKHQEVKPKTGNNVELTFEDNKASAKKGRGRRNSSKRFSENYESGNEFANKKNKNRTGKRNSESQPRKIQTNYADFLVNEELPAEDNYDSDEDPSFYGAAFYDPDLDFDEYSDGEIPDEETKELLEESDKALEAEYLDKLIKALNEMEIKKELEEKISNETEGSSSSADTVVEKEVPKPAPEVDLEVNKEVIQEL